MDSPCFEGQAGTFTGHYFSAMSQNFDSRLFSKQSFHKLNVRVKSTINEEHNLQSFLGDRGQKLSGQ